MAASSDYYEEQYGDENTATEKNIEMDNIYSSKYVKIFHFML